MYTHTHTHTRAHTHTHTYTHTHTHAHTHAHAHTHTHTCIHTHACTHTHTHTHAARTHTHTHTHTHTIHMCTHIQFNYITTTSYTINYNNCYITTAAAAAYSQGGQCWSNRQAVVFPDWPEAWAGRERQEIVSIQ